MANRAEYELNTLSLFSKSSGNLVDITQIFQSINIYESIFENFTTANVTLMDGVALIENLPLRGDELLVIDFETVNGSYSKVFDVIKINRLEEVEAKQLDFYTIHLATPIAELSKQNKLRIGVSGLESDIVKDIVETNLGLEMAETEDTKDEKKFIIPGWSPLQAINEISKYSQFNGGNSSASFLFFEDNKGYNFKSLEAIFKQGPEYNFKQNLPGEILAVEETVIEALQFSNYFDTDKVGTSAGLGCKTFEIDFVNKEVNTLEYLYTDMFTPFPKIDANAEQIKLTELSKSTRAQIRTYKTDTLVNRPEQYATRAFAFGLLENIKAVTTTQTNASVTIGKIATVKLITKDLTKVDEESLSRSGNYLITGVRHELSPDHGTTTIELRKPAFKEALV